MPNPRKTKRPKPEQGEAKQDFIRRCVRSIGGSETEALGVCAEAWNRARLESLVNDGRATLDASVSLEQAASSDAARRFAILAYTGKPVSTWAGRFVIDLAGMRLAKEKVPALRGHSTGQIVGVVDAGRADAAGFHVSGDFSRSAPAAAEVLGTADEGFPWQASVGIQALKILEVNEGATVEVNGRTLQGPLDVWTESEVFEVSFVPFGADDDTAAVALQRAEGLGQPNMEDFMNKKLRDFLLSRGLAANATEAEAWAFLAGLKLGAAELKAAGLDPVDMQPAPAPAQAASAATQPQAATAQAAPSADLATAQQEAVRLERERVSGIQAAVSAARLSREFGDGLVSSGLSLETAREAIIAELAKTQPAPVGPGAISTGADEADKFHLAAVDGICMGLGQRIERPAPGSADFRGVGLQALARMCLERSGVRTANLSADRLASMVLDQRRYLSGGNTVSDFPEIYRDVVNKRLQNAYAEAPATWRPWVNVVSATDFNNIYGVSLGDGPSLELINERGEYTHGELKESGESYRVKTYGRIATLTRQMIVNDTLRAMDRIPTMFGAAAARKIADIVYALLLSNPTMSDGTALFHADHGNLEASSKGAVSLTNLPLARAAMRKQTGPNGAKLDIQPAYLLVPVHQETSAEVLLRSATLPENSKPSGTYNPWNGKLIPIAEPRLDDSSTLAWYLVADPSQIDTIEVAFLDGREAPYVEDHAEFTTDGLSVKARLDVGCGVMDWRGFFKNPGA